MDLPISLLMGSRKRMLQESFTEDAVGFVGEEALLVLSDAVHLLALLAGLLIRERDDEPLLREQFGCHVRACVDDGGVDEHAVADAVEEGVAEGGFTALTAESACRCRA